MKLVAHRGYSADYPENSLESIHAALACGAAAVEFDVQMSADHIAVVCHDGDLERTAGQRLTIMEHTWAELAGVAIGEPQRFGERYANARLPSLQQVVELLAQWPAATAFVELKDETIHALGREGFLDCVLKTLAPVRRQCILIADDLDILLQARALGWPIGWIVHRWDEDDHHRAGAAAPDYLVVNHKYFPRREAAVLWPGPWAWVVYQTGDPEQAAALFAMGVEWVETNSICPLLAAMTGQVAP